jgi:hypothetical protein
VAAAVSGASLVGGACVSGAADGLPVGRLTLALRLGDRLEIAFLTAPPCPHPAARDPMTRATAAMASAFLTRFIARPPISRPYRAPCPGGCRDKDTAASLQLARLGVLTRHG